MSNSIILNQIKEKLTTIEDSDSTVIVLKGIPLSIVDPSAEKIRLEKAVENKMGYFMSIFGNRRFLSYEEFLVMADFVVAQYKDVIILNNNIYMEQYPVEECFTEEVRVGLLNHFDDADAEDDEIYIGDIGEYIAIFDGLKEYNGYLIGAYNDPVALSNNKVLTVNLFDTKTIDISSVSSEESIECDIVEEFDYIDFVKRLFAMPDEIYVRTTNYTGDSNRLLDHISILAAYWKDYTDIYYVKTHVVESSFEHRDDYTEILKKHWGFDTFRNISVYDMQKLESGQKEVKIVSQEAIISNLVDQVERCGDDRDFRDLFVTAPTGAGKSVMFQIPAIYLAEKYELLTIVISPLIGLMNDQVKNLELKDYSQAKTINSDISPIIRNDIISKVGDGTYNILYISPETLLSRSDVEQLIGDRTIGMIIIDEAHIVTTWGKQFRPDYWYLGDHIRKLRKKQIETKQRSFVIATFTATAIYHGLEDMYTETINSLHMLNPITYLGYVKRNDIEIVIDRVKKEKGERTEYELDKFEQIEGVLRRAIITNKKTLIYFPTVALIERCYEYLRSKHEIGRVSKYYGTLSKDEKQESYEAFCSKEKLVMLATKAFGMGIDIDDIEIVVHFAPTGNVCDYVQEIGRAARREGLIGEAYYNYNSKDFKHINRLHGLSTIQHYQLIKVIEKIDELYQQSLRKEKRGDYTRKRNTMLLDAENFAYIFGSPISDEDTNINKVKTALLLIQKDFEAKIGFSPINVRPIPMFSVGFFKMDTSVQNRLNKKYPGSVTEIECSKHICRVLLGDIWKKSYKSFSFPKFKFFLYSKNEELEFVSSYPMTPAISVSVTFESDYRSKFTNTWEALKKFIYKKVQLSEHTAVSEIARVLETECGFNKYKSRAICEVIIASMDSYRKNYAKTTQPIVLEKTTNAGNTKYQFNVAVNSYFNWVENGLRLIEKETEEGKLYLTDTAGSRSKEISVVLGILEAMDCMTFEMIGGANSQIYIYVNQIQALKNILNNPYHYHNRLLETVAERHLISVKMLTFMYESGFKSEEMWDVLESYFLGSIPDEVKQACKKEKPDIVFR